MVTLIVQPCKALHCFSTLEIVYFSNITAQVVSRGQIIYQDTIVGELGIITTIRFKVTTTMSPSARLIAYYITGTGEVVVDSTLLDVEDKFDNDVSPYTAC